MTGRYNTNYEQTTPPELVLDQTYLKYVWTDDKVAIHTWLHDAQIPTFNIIVKLRTNDEANSIAINSCGFFYVIYLRK